MHATEALAMHVAVFMGTVLIVYYLYIYMYILRNEAYCTTVSCAVATLEFDST